MISITLLTERTLNCIITISYDREVPGEDRRAMDAYNALVRLLREQGYHFYRLGIQAMDECSGSEQYSSFIWGLKELLDPRHVLAPGRYLPSRITNDPESLTTIGSTT
jgi:4-cresol dehydrogenase (hydroxylating)